MPKDDILSSIGDVVAAIDLKLSMLVDSKRGTEEAKMSEIKIFFDQIARMVSGRLEGDLLHAIGMLEKKLEIFDLDIKESLKSFSKTLIDYENKLEERIKREIQTVQEQVMIRLDHQQGEQAERLETIVDAIGSLGNAVVILSNSIEEFNNRLDPALKRLEEILSRPAEEPKRKGGLFGKSK